MSETFETEVLVRLERIEVKGKEVHKQLNDHDAVLYGSDGKDGVLVDLSKVAGLSGQFDLWKSERRDRLRLIERNMYLGIGGLFVIYVLTMIFLGAPRLTEALASVVPGVPG